MTKWYNQSGKEDDVVLQTRVRLARNFNDYAFAGHISAEDAKTMVDSVTARFRADQSEDYDCIYMANCSDSRRGSMKDYQMISSRLAKGKDGAVLLSKDESVAVMLNAEDHIRIQVLGNGMVMPYCFQKANEVDDYIDGHFEYAYDERFGYKTTFPTNIGTGLRASYTLHLPALADAKRMQQINTELSRFGIKFKNLYGDDNGNYGHFYQIASQRTLGVEEKEIIKDLNDIVMQLVRQEREQRQYYYENNRLQMEDEIYKSYGVVRYARKVSLKDAMVLLSEVMLGTALGVLNLDPNAGWNANRILMEIQPAVIGCNAGKDISVEECDIARADYLRKNLPELV